jgi:hypothetical protein
VWLPVEACDSGRQRRQEEDGEQDIPIGPADVGAGDGADEADEASRKWASGVGGRERKAKGKER